ncbi:MAG: pyruvate dehydrogenase (acetyl-transferring) E1 component subunit alpha [Chromatiales bacterium]|jgi:pyruvate dehydrogenase E1 component alpha subunit|nr:pyruvate dehydrogenase (acetyl-transferring) E1 component subunit alpha [Chromatiales bacterium]
MTVDTTPQFAPAREAVDPIQFVDESGQLHPGVEPALAPERVFEGLRLMMFARAFDAKCFSLQRQGKVGTFAPMVGQEACTAGSALALDKHLDWIVPQYRELPAQVLHGHPVELIARYRMGHPEGGSLPENVRVMQFQISLAAQIPHAVGLAWGMQMKGEPGISVAYFGDGASSEGDFHEACNLAGVVKAPVIFFIQNNQWAISTPREMQSGVADLAARAPGYGFHGVSVDGNDMLAVHQVTAEARARALAGDGPTIIEAHTFRMWAHTTADDPTRYVDPAVKARWEARDPIDRMQRYLKGIDAWSAAQEDQWNQEISAEVEAIFERALAESPGTPEDVFEHVFARRTPAQERQRRFDLGLEA